MNENSTEAYKGLIEAGIGKRQAEVFELIRKNPDKTDYELAHLKFCDANRIRPRRKELLDRGLIQKSGNRKDMYTNKSASTWKALDVSLMDLKSIKKEKKVCPCCGRSYWE